MGTPTITWITYQSGSRCSDLRTVVVAGKPRVQVEISASGQVRAKTLVAELLEGQHSAHAWWQTKVFEADPADHAFEVPVELVRKVRQS